MVRKGGASVGTDKAASRKGAVERVNDAVRGGEAEVDDDDDVVDADASDVATTREAELTFGTLMRAEVAVVASEAAATAAVVGTTPATSFFRVGHNPSIQGSQTTSRPIPSSAHPGA